MKLTIKQKCALAVSVPLAFGATTAESCLVIDDFHVDHITQEHVDHDCGVGQVTECGEEGNILSGWPYDIVWWHNDYERKELSFDYSTGTTHYHWVPDGSDWERRNCYHMKYVAGYWAGDPPGGPCYNVNGVQVG